MIVCHWPSISINKPRDKCRFLKFCITSLYILTGTGLSGSEFNGVLSSGSDGIGKFKALDAPRVVLKQCTILIIPVIIIISNTAPAITQKLPGNGEKWKTLINNCIFTWTSYSRHITLHTSSSVPIHKTKHNSISIPQHLMLYAMQAIPCSYCLTK